MLPAKLNLRGKHVLLRLDWNVPLGKDIQPDDMIKIKRSAQTVKDLVKRGAVVLILTHLGRPEKRDKKFSTARLLPMAEAYLDLPVMFCGENITKPNEMLELLSTLDLAKPGQVYLFENVRFYAGEEKNDLGLAKLYAGLADMYMNDAFASCHRAHVSVAGIAKYLPHYAGPELQKEVKAVDKLINQPKKPFLAIIGGAKLSTKMPLINSLLLKADKIMIGGAMADVFFAVKRIKIGKSLVEKSSLAYARKLIKNRKIILPQDVLVATKITKGARPRRADLKSIKANEMIVDIGPDTMKLWSQYIKTAKTLLWNGPLGITEVPAFSHGSLVIGTAMAVQSRGQAYGVVGGGDTVPVALQTGISEWFDHISMGGGALLEYIAKKGKLPGLQALQTSSKSKSKKS